MADLDNSPMGQVDSVASLLIGGEDQAEDIGRKQADEEAVAGDSESAAVEDEAALGEEETSPEDEPTWGKVLGVDESNIILDDQGQLKGLKVKVDGVEEVVDVKELINGYGFNKHVTQKSMALAEEKKAFDAIRSEAAKVYHDKLTTVDKLTGVMQKSLLKEFNAVNWDQLRQSNPAEYAAMMTDFQTRQGQIEQLMGALQQEAHEEQTRSQTEFQQGYQKYLSEQYERVLKNNPQWADTNKMKADMSAMASFVQASYGITLEEFSMLNDARHIEILKDAMAFRNGKAAVEQKIKNAPVPKFQKPGTRKPMSQLTKLTLASKKATGYKQRDLQADAVAELLTNGI